MSGDRSINDWNGVNDDQLHEEVNVYYLVLDPDWMIALSVTADTWNSRVPNEWGHVSPLNNLPARRKIKFLFPIRVQTAELHPVMLI